MCVSLQRGRTCPSFNIDGSRPRSSSLTWNWSVCVCLSSTSFQRYPPPVHTVIGCTTCTPLQSIHCCRQRVLQRGVLRRVSKHVRVSSDVCPFSCEVQSEVRGCSVQRHHLRSKAAVQPHRVPGCRQEPVHRHLQCMLHHTLAYVASSAVSMPSTCTCVE